MKTQEDYSTMEIWQKRKARRLFYIGNMAEKKGEKTTLCLLHDNVEYLSCLSFPLCFYSRIPIVFFCFYPCLVPVPIPGSFLYASNFNRKNSNDMIRHGS